MCFVDGVNFCEFFVFSVKILQNYLKIHSTLAKICKNSQIYLNLLKIKVKIQGFALNFVFAV